MNLATFDDQTDTQTNQKVTKCDHTKIFASFFFLLVQNLHKYLTLVSKFISARLIWNTFHFN